MIKTFDQATAALANPNTTNGDRWIAAHCILDRMVAEYPEFATLINEEYFLTDDWNWDGTEKITGIAYAIRQDFEKQTRVTN